jgi:hypothetical protein
MHKAINYGDWKSMKPLIRKEIVVFFLAVVLLPTILTLPAAAASPATILGTVKNTSGSPISGVKVTLKIGSSTKDTDYTDSSGRYDVTCSVSRRTRVSLTFTKSGYKTYTTSVYVMPGFLTLKNVVIQIATTQGVKGTVRDSGGVVPGILVKAFIGSSLKGSDTTDSSGKYSIYLAVASSTTVTMKYYRSGNLVLTKSVTVNPGSYTTKDVTIPDLVEFDVLSRLWGGKTYRIFMAQPNHYAEFGWSVSDLRLDYRFCPETGEVRIDSYSLTFSTFWDEQYFWGNTLEAYLKIASDQTEFIGRYRALNDDWDSGDSFSVSGNVPHTYDEWTDPYFTFKMVLGCPLHSQSYVMEMKFRISEPFYNWFEYDDHCYRSYGWTQQEIFPDVVFDSWSNPTIITEV